MRVILRILVLVLNLVAASALLLAVLGQFLNPATLPILSIFGIVFEWLIWLNLAFGVCWLFTKKKVWCIVSIIALLMALGGVFRTFSVSENDVLEEGKSIRILSYNTRCLGFQNGTLADNDVLNYLRQQDADIVCLQEFVAYKHGRTWQEVKRYLGYPYSYIDFKTYGGKRQYGLAVFSKYPLIHKQTLRYESSTNISNRCDVVIEGDTIRLFTNHLQSNRLNEKDFALEHKGREEYVDELQAKAEKVGRKITSNTQLRAAQAKLVQREIAASPYPVVVCGDFNDVPVSYTYRTIAKGLQDAFLVADTWSLGHTFYKGIIGIRIDYILCDKSFGVSDFRIDKVSYSDHYPISCTLTLPQK